MTVNMSYLLNDVVMMRELALAGFNRRRQLVPFPLEPNDLIDVMHRPKLAGVVRLLRSEQPKTLNWGQSAELVMPMPEMEMDVLIKVQAREAIVLPVNAHGPARIYDGVIALRVPCVEGAITVRLREWAWKAAQIELENRWAMRIINMLLSNTTTHQQVHRYMPELYQLIAHQQEKTLPANHWGGRRIVDVHAALKEIGSARARKLDISAVVLRDRANLRAVVAQCLLLSEHGGLEKGSMFDGTWVDFVSKDAG